MCYDIVITEILNDKTMEEDRMIGPVWLCSKCPAYFETDVECMVHEKMHKTDELVKMRQKNVKRCPGCKGEGMIDESTICPVCKGRKLLRTREKQIEIYEPVE